MAADLSTGMTFAVLVVIGVLIIAIGVLAWLFIAFIILVVSFALERGWRRLRVSTLGGVTTLEPTLSGHCVMCRRTLEAGEKVRTLSCNHVFHYGDGEKCESHIDKLFLVAPRMSCPICQKTPHPVLPWKAPPS